MTSKGYYFDKAKKKWVGRVTIDKKRHHIGNFQTENEAKEAVKKYLIEVSKNMPPRRKANDAPALAADAFTLKQAHTYLDGLANAAKSIQIWKTCLVNLLHYHLDDGETEMNTAELTEKYADENLRPLLTNFERVSDIVENKIKRKDNGNNIAMDTQKNYYNAIVRLTQKGSPFVVDKIHRHLYIERLRDMDRASGERRDEGIEARGNLLNPDLDWPKVVKEYDEWIAAQPFTNTEKGRKDLKYAVVAGLYVLHKPRRVADYSTLQVYSKLPNEKDRVNKNILFVEKDKMTFYINVFKTRWRVNGPSRQRKELMPEYVKEVTPRLATLLKDYIKKAEIKDMSKRTADEVRQRHQYYIFAEPRKELEDSKKELEEMKKLDNIFSKTATLAFKNIFIKENGRKRDGLSVNTFRHIWQTWRLEHFAEFTINQHKDWNFEAGDMPKNYPSADRYKLRKLENVGKSKTEIVGDIQDKEYARGLAEVGIEDVGVGNKDIEIMERIGEEEDYFVDRNDKGDFDMEAAIKKLGKLEVEIARLQRAKENILKFFA